MAAAALRLAGVRWQPAFPCAVRFRRARLVAAATGARVLVARAAAKLAAHVSAERVGGPAAGRIRPAGVHVSQNPVNADSLMRQGARWAGQQTVGRLPRSRARLSAPLAMLGGTPVRNLRYRPWPQSQTTLGQWLTSRRPGVPPHLPQRRRRVAADAAKAVRREMGAVLRLPAWSAPRRTAPTRCASRWPRVFDHDGLAYGGEVIVPNLSFIASATAALDRRFGVAFVDVDPGTLNIDPARVEEAIVPGRTRAIMPVHQFGQPADMTALQAHRAPSWIEDHRRRGAGARRRMGIRSGRIAG